MCLEKNIKTIFGEQPFTTPVFYNNPQGLRFELSEGGDWLEQFDTACKKAEDICSTLFNEEITVCIRMQGSKSLLSVLPVIRDLEVIGLYPASVKKEYWKEKNTNDPVEWLADEGEYWHTIAYPLPRKALKKLLWCCFARDLGIKPCSAACFYLIDLKNAMMVWPYDDRGMDIVGPNHDGLSKLYHKYAAYLLDYDREIMDATFAKST